MKKAKDLSGLKFNRWLVLKMIGKLKNGATICLCQCDCGIEKEILSAKLKNGDSKSCGCLRNEKIESYGARFNGEVTAEYRIWKGMKKRCYNNNDFSYKNYGGRGIIISKEWLNNFPQFLSDMGKRPSKKHSIERVDVNGNYEKNNCCWVTNIVQCNNTRRNVFFEYNNKLLTIRQLSDISGINYKTIRMRLDKGWGIKKSVETPLLEIKYEYKGKLQNLNKWSLELNVKALTLRKRIINLNWTVEKAFETPVQSRKKAA